MNAARTIAAAAISLALVAVLGAAIILLATLVGIRWALAITAVWAAVIAFALALGKVGSRADRTAQRLHQQQRETGR